MDNEDYPSSGWNLLPGWGIGDVGAAGPGGSLGSVKTPLTRTPQFQFVVQTRARCSDFHWSPGTSVTSTGSVAKYCNVGELPGLETPLAPRPSMRRLFVTVTNCVPTQRRSMATVNHSVARTKVRSPYSIDSWRRNISRRWRGGQTMCAHGSAELAPHFRFIPGGAPSPLCARREDGIIAA